MNELHVPWTKLVAAAKELEFIAVKQGITTALRCPVGDNVIVAEPTRKDKNQLEFDFKRAGDLPQLDD
jgi:hypothetical protein